MRAEKKKIDSGSEYEGLFPKEEGTEVVVIKRLRNVEQTVEQMNKIVRLFAFQSQDFADEIYRKYFHNYPDGNTYGLLNYLWNECYRIFQYQDDAEDREQLRTPARSFADRKEGIDCDCMSIFIGSVLYNLDIPFFFRITGYTKKEKDFWGFERMYCDDYQHVFPIADVDGQQVVLDLVLTEFDYQKPYCRYKDGALVFPEISLSGDGDDIPDLDDAIAEARKLAQRKGGKWLESQQKRIKKAEDFLAKNSELILKLAEENPDLMDAIESGDWAVIIPQVVGLGWKLAAPLLLAAGPAGIIVFAGLTLLANLFGYPSVEAIIEDVARMAMTEVPEMMLWLAAAIQGCATDMMVFLTEGIDLPFEDYINGTNWTVWLLDAKAHKDVPGEWLYKAKQEWMREMFESLRKVMKDNKSFGLDDKTDINGVGKNQRFTWWARNYRKRFHIRTEGDLLTLGIDVDSFRKQDDWYPITGGESLAW